MSSRTILKERRVEERIAEPAREGKIRLPLKNARLSPFRPIKAKGKPASEIIISERSQS
jgi:hypothetical protein